MGPRARASLNIVRLGRLSAMGIDFIAVGTVATVGALAIVTLRLVASRARTRVKERTRDILKASRAMRAPEP